MWKLQNWLSPSKYQMGVSKRRSWNCVPFSLGVYRISGGLFLIVEGDFFKREPRGRGIICIFFHKRLQKEKHGVFLLFFFFP